ncbi:hypothetical protein D3C84_762610 [compost metagenome]
MQVFRQPLAAHQGTEQPATKNPEETATQNHAAESQQAFFNAITFGVGNDEAIDDYRQQRADRIDDNPFPTQDVGNRGFGSYDAQHGHNHGRPGDQRQAAEKYRQHPVKTQ